MAWMESIAQKLERERKLREQFPEFEVAPSPDRVMQVDNHNMQNGGSITRFSQAVMQVARHVSELANESGSAPMDVQFTADRLSAGIPGYQTDNYTATPQKRAGVPLGVAEAFPEEAAGRRTYGTPGSTGESGQLWNTPVAEYATNLPVVGGGIQHALNTPYVGDAIAEATRPRTWAEMAVLAPVASGIEAAGIGGRIAAGLLTPLGADAGIAANVAGNVGMNLGAHVGADVAGSLTENAPAPVQMGAQVLGGLVGGGAGLGAVSALSRPETIANAAKLATGYRDLTKGIPVGASIKDIGGGVPGERALPQSIASKAWFHGSGTASLSAEKLNPYMTKENNLFGMGIYLTDSADVAAQYAQRRGKAGASTIYQANVSPDIRALDMELPAPQGIIKSIIAAAQSSGDEDVIHEVANGLRPDMTTEQAWSVLSDSMTRNRVTSATAVDVMESLSGDIQDLGYDALIHTGGVRTGNKPHQVLILLDPNQVSGGDRSSYITNFSAIKSNDAVSRNDIGDELNALDEQVKAEGGWTAQTIAKYQELTGRRPTASMTRPAESIGPPNTSPEGIRQGAGNAIVKGQGAANINLTEQIPLLKVYNALDEAKALLPERAANVTALRRQQAAAYESVAQRVREGKLTPQEGARMALGAMHGSAEMPTFTPLRDSLDQNAIDETLRGIVSSDVSPFARSGAQSAFYKLLDGYPPTPSELKAWGDVFGPDQMEPIQSALRAKGIGPSTSIGEHLLDIANAPRSLVASVDFSGYLRQGAVLGAGHPLTFAKDAPVYIKAFASEQYARGVDDAIRAAPFAQELQDFGLYIAPWKDGRLDNREEAFMSRLVGKLPLVEQSQRGYVTFLNKLRSDVGNSVVAGWDESQRTPENLLRLTSFLNAATGRGDLKALNDSGPALNALFFSPRFFASRVQMAGQAVGALGSLGKSATTLHSFDPVSKEIAKDTLAFVGTGIGILTLLKKSGAADVQLDPRSSDFGKARVGNTRYDFWAGYQQIARFTAQLISNQAKSTGSGNVYGLNRAETVGKFLQSKLAPAPGLAIDVLRGETPLGDELTPSAGTIKAQAWNRLVPLFVQDLTDAIKSDGAMGALKGLPSGFGVGTQTYESPSAALYGQLDSLASELKRTDEQGNPITKFTDLQPADQSAIMSAHPDLAQQRSDQRIAQGGDKATLEQMKVDARTAQENDNTRLQNGEIDWKQWKDNRSRRLNELQGASQVVYGKEPIANPKNAYERWLNQIQASVTSDGVDWNAVDAWVAQQPEPDQKFISDNTGAYSTDLEKQRRAVADKLDASGYFDIRDRVWSRVAAQDPATAAYKTAQDFENAVATRFRAQLADRGVTGVAAEIMVSDLIEKLPQVKMWSKVSNDIEEMWIKANPQLASDAIRYGYLDPSSLRTAEKSVLVGGAQ